MACRRMPLITTACSEVIPFIREYGVCLRRKVCLPGGPLTKRPEAKPWIRLVRETQPSSGSPSQTVFLAKSVGLSGLMVQARRFWQRVSKGSAESIVRWPYGLRCPLFHQRNLGFLGRTRGTDGGWDFSVENGRLKLDAGGGQLTGATILNDDAWHHAGFVFPPIGSGVEDAVLYVTVRWKTIQL